MSVRSGPARSRLGVGIIGAGHAARAIHGPTLLRLADRFDVVHIADPDLEGAGALARLWATARVSADATEMLNDPRVDVVAICSPSQFHHDHVLEALRSGVKAVLCEKPLATTHEEVEHLRAASALSGTALRVGAQHQYDPAWRAALAQWTGEGTETVAIASRIFLPPNERFESWATQSPPRSPRPAARKTLGEQFSGAILGVAVHDLPLIARLGDDVTANEVIEASTTAPYGYAATLTGPGPAVSLLAEIHTHPQLTWELTAWSTTSCLSIAFPPSYVHAGSAVATITTKGSATRFGPYPENGYVHEWLAMWDAANGAHDVEATRVSLDATSLAIRIAEDGARLIDARVGA